MEKRIKQKHKGAHSELRACLWLLENGYEVFRNISDRGEIDIIAIKEDEIIKIDVKTIGKNGIYSYQPKQTKYQYENNILSMGVDHETGDVFLNQPNEALYNPKFASCKKCGVEIKIRYKSQENKEFCSNLCRSNYNYKKKIRK